MPIHKVPGGYRFGQSGKVYPTVQGAQKQAVAIFANGYHAKKDEQKQQHRNAQKAALDGLRKRYQK